MTIDRRQLLKLAAATPLAIRASQASGTPLPSKRVRPSDVDWPSDSQWALLGQQVGESLVRVRSPWAPCQMSAEGGACAQLFKSPQNPYVLGDDIALTQTYGWVNAWMSSPSVWAVAARNTADVVAAVNFARSHRLRLAVKGGGHSYQGTSNAPDSLLVCARAARGGVHRKTKRWQTVLPLPRAARHPRTDGPASALPWHERVRLARRCDSIRWP